MSWSEEAMQMYEKWHRSVPSHKLQSAIDSANAEDPLHVISAARTAQFMRGGATRRVYDGRGGMQIVTVLNKTEVHPSSGDMPGDEEHGPAVLKRFLALRWLLWEASMSGWLLHPLDPSSMRFCDGRVVEQASSFPLDESFEFDRDAFFDELGDRDEPVKELYERLGVGLKELGCKTESGSTPESKQTLWDELYGDPDQIPTVPEDGLLEAVRIANGVDPLHTATAVRHVLAVRGMPNARMLGGIIPAVIRRSDIAASVVFSYLGAGEGRRAAVVARLRALRWMLWQLELRPWLADSWEPSVMVFRDDKPVRVAAEATMVSGDAFDQSDFLRRLMDA